MFTTISRSLSQLVFVVSTLFKGNYLNGKIRTHKDIK